MPCSWKSYCGSGFALAMYHRLQWFIHLWTHKEGRWTLTLLFGYCTLPDICWCWQICRDFMVGKCFRTSCRFMHSVEAKNAELRQGFSGPGADVCKDFLNGKCNRPVCRFYHPPTTAVGTTATTTSSVPEPSESSVCIVWRDAIWLPASVGQPLWQNHNSITFEDQFFEHSDLRHYILHPALHYYTRLIASFLIQRG